MINAKVKLHALAEIEMPYMTQKRRTVKTKHSNYFRHNNNCIKTLYLLNTS